MKTSIKNICSRLFKLSLPALFYLICLPLFSSALNNDSNNKYHYFKQGTIAEELEFSKSRELCFEPFELSIVPADAGASIYYTLDCSVPAPENGILYSSPIRIDSTTIVKAISVLPDSTSKVYTHTYIFPESVMKQGKLPSGFPEYWGGATIIPGDYEMDPNVMLDPAYAGEVIDAFQSLPSLSLTMDVEEWFNDETGLYVGYPNTDVKREKPVTAEFIFNTEQDENFVISCGVQNQGGTSIVKWKSPKQSMRLLFKEIYGPKRLNQKLFHDSDIRSINTLVVDNMLNHTWIHPTDIKQRLHALYLRDQLTSDLHNEMGGLAFHGRYFHLFLNGLYWGICNLHERPDDAFLSEYLDTEREAFDVIKHGPDQVVAGVNDLYLRLLSYTRSESELVTDKDVEDIARYLDLPAFIDYMILNFYLGNFDWARHNFYAAFNRKSGNGFRFYAWDSEHVIRFSDVQYNNTKKNDEGAPTEIHTYLKRNEEYRIQFGDAVYKHLFNDGALTPDNFRKAFLRRVNEIEKAIVLESARWGDYRLAHSGVTYTKNDYWIPEVNKVLDEYIPFRRDIVIDQLKSSYNLLFPPLMPPLIEAVETQGGHKEITLIDTNNKNGEIYFTVDGSDPRLKGGAINGMKYEGKINITGTSIVKARIYSENDKTWSALAEEIYLFDDVYGEKIVITEIMYHPDSDYPEFLEVMNFGDSPVNLNGFVFSGGINYVFKTNLNVQPGSGIVLTDKASLFNEAYGFYATGQYEKQLSNSGEAIYLTNIFGQLVDSVSYSDSIPWPAGADGEGYSLELISPEMNNALVSSWRVSEKMFGTPYNPSSGLNVEGDVYPNPFTAEVAIRLEGTGLTHSRFKVEVFHQTGTKVRDLKTSSYNSQIELNLRGLSPGMYFIRVKPLNNYEFKPVVFKAIKIN